MRQRRETASASSKGSSSGEASEEESSSNGAEIRTTAYVGNPRRSSFVWLALLLIITYCCSSIYHYQFQSMPVPLTAEEAGKRGFSEIEAFKHVRALTQVGPHPVGSEALHLALQYVLTACENIKKTALWEVDVEVDLFHAKSGANHLRSGLFSGRTLVYSDLNHVVVRILPKYVSEARGQSILVSSHIDTVISTAGAGDCSSCVGVMLELARGISQWAHGLKRAIIFLFNTGEEEGLNGAHSFITQHPWSKTVRVAIDLEAMGIGGKSTIFQAGPHPWAIENFALVAKYPSGQVIAQDLFSSGAIKSATDFQVYKEVAGLSGLDFAYLDNTAVYHTKNDKLELLKTGSLQHLGENMLAFLLHIGASSHIPEGNSTESEEDISKNNAIYFDILGMYMVVYRQKFANMLHNSVIMQSLLIWVTSLVMGGIPAAASLALSCLSVLLMWVFALSFSFLVSFLLPLISSSPVPYVSSPMLVVGLFGAPAFLGALTGQHFGFLLLQKYLSNTLSKGRQLTPIIKAAVVKMEAERWLYKAGSFQWLILLILGNYFKIGSSYLALVWLVSPAFAYGFFEATLTPARLPKPLKLATIILGLATPILFSAGIFIRSFSTRKQNNNNRGRKKITQFQFQFQLRFVEMATLSSFIATPKNPKTHFLSGSSFMSMDKCFLKISTSGHFTDFSLRAKATCNQPLVIQAGGDGGRPSSGSIFVGGFVLGGLIAGALGCLYAPQISRALAGADSKDLMRKLPKFMYDEEKALERTREVLTEKIAQLNSAIDGVSAQLRPDEDSNEIAVNSEEIETPISDESEIEVNK